MECQKRSGPVYILHNDNVQSRPIMVELRDHVNRVPDLLYQPGKHHCIRTIAPHLSKRRKLGPTHADVHAERANSILPKRSTLGPEHEYVHAGCIWAKQWSMPFRAALGFKHEHVHGRFSNEYEHRFSHKRIFSRRRRIRSARTECRLLAKYVDARFESKTWTE